MVFKAHIRRVPWKAKRRRLGPNPHTLIEPWLYLTTIHFHNRSIYLLTSGGRGKENKQHTE